MQKYQYSVLEVCQRIYGHVSGTGDPIPEDELVKIFYWLEYRLVGGGWDKDKSPDLVGYQNAVRSLAFEALYLAEDELFPPLK